MAYPSLLAGQDITADLLASMLPLGVTKGSDESRASTTTLAVDGELSIAVDANASYRVIGYVVYSQNLAAGASAGLVMGWSGPTSATFQWSSRGTSGPTALTTFDVTSNSISGTRSLPSNLGTRMHASPIGTLRTSGTAGNFALRWAQVASNATATIVHADSWLELRRYA